MRVSSRIGGYQKLPPSAILLACKQERELQLNNNFCTSNEMSGRQNPSDFLKQIIGRPVVVKLNSGVDYRGMSARDLISFDRYDRRYCRCVPPPCLPL